MRGLDRIEARAQKLIGADFHFYWVSQPCLKTSLTEGELQRLTLVQYLRQPTQYLIGLSALKQALRRVEGHMDTSRIQFPSSTVSLSHVDQGALSVGLTPAEAGKLGISGIGVDIDFLDYFQERSKSMYLTKNERQAFQAYEEVSTKEEAQVLAMKLWTMKEALFKASPDNDHLQFNQFELRSIVQLSDVPATDIEGRNYSVWSFEIDKGFISLAISWPHPEN